MTRAVLPALLPIALLACDPATLPANYPSCTYEQAACDRLNASLVVAPELCDDAIAAATEWCAATDGLACVSVVCGAVPAPRPYAIALAHDGAHGSQWATTLDATIVAYGLHGREQKQVLAHELGHFFGLTHDPESGALMCSDIGCAATRVTARDARRLRASLGTAPALAP